MTTLRYPHDKQYVQVDHNLYIANIGEGEIQIEILKNHTKVKFEPNGLLKAIIKNGQYGYQYNNTDYTMGELHDKIEAIVSNVVKDIALDNTMLFSSFNTDMFGVHITY